MFNKNKLNRISQEELNKKFDTLKSVQIFNVQNEKVIPNWNKIDSIFKSEDVATNPVKLIVICGQPRIGKSTFCNVLYNECDWICEGQVNDGFEDSYDDFATLITDSIDSNCKIFYKKKMLDENEEKIYKVFETSSSTFDPKSYGISITPKPIVVRDGFMNIQFNVFIVDVEGILGALSEKFIYQQLFVLSALMSTHFVYLLRHPFDLQNYEILKTYSTLTQTMNDKLQKLIILVTNVFNKKEFKFGSKDSEKYMKALNKEIPGIERIKIDLKEFKQYFESIECFLLPEPGDKIRRRELNDSDIVYSVADIGKQYLKYCLKFDDQYIVNDNTIKCSQNVDYMTGEKFADYLRALYKLIFTDGKLGEIPSSLKLLSDKMNGGLVTDILGIYETAMMPFLNKYIFSQELISMAELRSEHKLHSNKGLQEFKSNPWSYLKGSNGTIYSKELESKLNYDFEQFLINSDKYKLCFKTYLTQMIEFLRQNDVEVIKDTISVKHGDYSEESLNNFRNGCANNGRIYTFDFDLMLKSEIDRFYEPIKTNIILLKETMYRHENEMRREYSTLSWTDKWFNSSNKWIDLDNMVFPKLYNEFTRNISIHVTDYGYNIEDRLFVETNNIVNKEYEKLRHNENMLGGLAVGIGSVAASSAGAFCIVAASTTAATFTSVATGGLGLVTLGAGVGYFIVRKIKKPNKKRDELQKIIIK